jgi:hypothetical protein
MMINGIESVGIGTDSQHAQTMEVYYIHNAADLCSTPWSIHDVSKDPCNISQYLPISCRGQIS